MTNNEPKGWYSRDYLPHCDKPGLLQSITFRLHDAVPKPIIEQWKDELRWVDGLAADDLRVVELRRRIDRYEDAGHGACWLRDARVAPLVENTLHYFDGQRYRLIAWCVMPNHVHTLVETREGWPLNRVVHSWKSFTAQKANVIVGRKGPFWFREYHDRYIRNDKHLANTIEYIENNPNAAGLVEHAAKWRFSSARWK